MCIPIPYLCTYVYFKILTNKLKSNYYHQKGEHPDLEAELNRELQDIREDGVMINGNTIIAHALAIARKLNIQKT